MTHPVSVRAPTGTSTRAPAAGVVDAVGDAVREQIELRNGNGDRRQAGHGALTGRRRRPRRRSSARDLLHVLPDLALAFGAAQQVGRVEGRE
ncbi:MAG: hypothetical protein MZV64_73110 [Ignavibacteriales bacterium]|nr:hypothetical protein [Ignavibacteriales bacterium]